MNRIALLIVVAALGACTKQEPAAETPSVAAPAAAPAPEKPAAALTPEQQAALVRPHSPVLGNPTARVTVVEYLDPACEACRAYEPLVKQILFLYPQEVRVVVRFAAFHQGSDGAIRLLYAAQRQRKFDKVLTALFDGQDQWASHQAPNLDVAWQLARAAGLSLDSARNDAKSAAATELLRIDGEDGLLLKVDRTPTFFVNGRPLEDFGAEQLMNLVAEEVKAASRPD